MEAISLREIYLGNLYARKYELFCVFVDDEDEVFENGWLVYDPEETDIKQCRFEVVVEGIVIKHFNPFFDKEIVCSFCDYRHRNITGRLVQFLAGFFPLHSLSQEAIDWWAVRTEELRIQSEALTAEFEESMVKRMSEQICAEIDNEIIESIMKVAGALPK